MNKKEFFKKKIQSVTYTIWELEFKLAKSRQVREGVRLDRDRVLQARELTITRPDSEEKTAELGQMDANVKRYEAQLDMIDREINSYDGDENAEPVIGIIDQIKGYSDLREMYKSYLKSI